VLYDSGPTCFDVVVKVVSLKTNVVKHGSEDTCKLYDVAPLDAFQLNVKVVDKPVAPLLGDNSIV
jgi:hypothetical protein